MRMHIPLCRRSVKTPSPQSEVRAFIIPPTVFWEKGVGLGPRDQGWMLSAGSRGASSGSQQLLIPTFLQAINTHTHALIRLRHSKRRSAQKVQIVGMSLAEFPWGAVGSCSTD